MRKIYSICSTYNGFAIPMKSVSYRQIIQHPNSATFSSVLWPTDVAPIIVSELILSVEDYSLGRE